MTVLKFHYKRTSTKEDAWDALMRCEEHLWELARMVGITGLMIVADSAQCVRVELFDQGGFNACTT